MVDAVTQLERLAAVAGAGGAAGLAGTAAVNPRARSAKLRLGTRLEAPARTTNDPLSFAGLPALADIERL